MRLFLFVFLFMLVQITYAQWSEDADQCARLVGNNEQDIRHCTKAIESGVLEAANLAQTCSNRAYLYWEEERLDVALHDAHRAAELDRQNLTALNMVGRIYLDSGDCANALTWFDKALDHVANENEVTDGDSAEFAASLNSFICHDRLGNPERAKKFLTRTFELDPDHTNLQESYYKHGLK
jgi:tetratricopeptide (TPR) repeat protein